ncbi:MAG: flagellar basal body rod protein FlgC [Terriglobia bacterium]
MNFFNILDISSSALKAERERAEVAASNLANAETSHTAEGGPYRRQLVVFGPQRIGQASFADSLDRVSEMHARGVQVERVVDDSAPPIRRSEPGNPYADAQGYVYYPNINPVQEMADLMSASRSYQLNVSAVQTTKAMIQESFQILLG